MAADFPELNSFNTLMRFALSLELALAELAEQAKALDICTGESAVILLEDCAKRHRKRHIQLERMCREQLNEVILQPVDGMCHSDYIPPLTLTKQTCSTEIFSTLILAENAAIRFYQDASTHAANVLAGLSKHFKKLASESQTLHDKLASHNA
jgi:hypothetical protein